MGKKRRNEVRDAVHGLIEFNDMEKHLIDSTPFQRLRDIHQLAMCYQVYPGTTHKRFEHCLGVMYLAGRIFDTIFDDRNISGVVRERLDAHLDDDTRRYWRRVVRAGALLHDIGHLPFSHAAEKDLLPDGWNHERITADVIRQSEIAGILASNTPVGGVGARGIRGLGTAQTSARRAPDSVASMARLIERSRHRKHIRSGPNGLPAPRFVARWRDVRAF